MNREETLALYEQGKDAWNKWANEMLEEKKRLEEDGEWETNHDIRSLNGKTNKWFIKAAANFSTADQPHIFEINANFSHFIFPGETNFSQIQFKKKVNFHKTIFQQNSNFIKAIFQDPANFNDAIFKKRANFNSSIFKGNATFTNSKFEHDAYFKHAQFNDETNYINAIFKNESYFKNCNFYGKTDFNKAVFKETLDFSNSIFEQPTYFNGIKFHKHTFFIKTTFSESAKFQNSQFYGYTLFTDARFKNKINFAGTTFNGNTSFNNSYIDGPASFNSSVFNNFSTFENTTFKDEANLMAIQANNAISLKRTKFQNQVPNFIQANFKEAPRLDNIEFGDDVAPGSFINSITTFIHPDIKARYQALKRLAVQAHDHENEQRFWAGELRSDRSLRNEDGSWNRRPLVSAFWWGNIAYGCVSDYGRSIVRPLASLIALIFLMTGIHIYAHNSLNKETTSELRTKTHITKQSNLKDCDIRSSAFRVAAKNGAIGLLQNPAKRSTFVRDYTCLYGTYNDNVTPKIPNSIFWIELLHTLFSAILIFLTLLGIRNNFKLK